MENKKFKTKKKLGEFKTFGEYIKEARKKEKLLRMELAEKLERRGLTATDKLVKMWECDARYPDINYIYALAEILHLNPNELLEAKLQMQEAGLNAIDMLTMRVVCNLIDVTIWKIHQFYSVMIWVVLVGAAAVAWGVNIPIIGPIIEPILAFFVGSFIGS